MKDGAVFIVAEGDIVEHQPGALDDERGSLGNVLHLDVGVDERKHSRHVDKPLPDGAINHAEHVERAEQLRKVSVDENQIADGELAVRPAIDGVAHGARHQRIDDQRLGDVERAQRVFRANGGIGIGSGGLRIAFLLAVFGAEIFDGFKVEQRIDRARKCLPVEPVHLFAQG